MFAVFALGLTKMITMVSFDNKEHRNVLLWDEIPTDFEFGEQENFTIAFGLSKWQSKEIEEENLDYGKLTI